MSPDDAYRAWDGQTGIDGIYRDASGNYVIVESKATGGVKASDPEGCVARLCTTKDGRQMSNDWIIARLEKLVPDVVERDRIIKGLETENGLVKKIYAQTDERGTTYHEIGGVLQNTQEAVIGKPWNP